MEVTELFYPQLEVQLGGYTCNQGVEFEIHSAAASYFDWAKIRFTEQYQPELSIGRKDDAVIRLGYDNTLLDIFEGYVWKPYAAGTNADEIILKDAMLALEETVINNTFMDTTPQEMISYFLSQAGISNIQLSGQHYPERRVIPIRKMNVIQAINTVHSAWNIVQPFFFAGGVFYWGAVPKQEKVYQFEYGVNILNLRRESGCWFMETVSAPFVRHSDSIVVVHPKVSGTFKVMEVVFKTNDAGFIRTEIKF